MCYFFISCEDTKIARSKACMLWEKKESSIAVHCQTSTVSSFTHIVEGLSVTSLLTSKIYAPMFIQKLLSCDIFLKLN